MHCSKFGPLRGRIKCQKSRRNNPHRCRDKWQHSAAIFDRREINNELVRGQRSRNLAAPEIVQIFVLPDRNFVSHLEPIRLHGIEWPQRAVQAGQNPQVRLRILAVGRRKFAPTQAAINITDETIERGQRLLGLKVRLPITDELLGFASEHGRNVHRAGELRRSELLQAARQLFGFGQELR